MNDPAYYEVISMHSGKCLDLDLNSGSKLQIWDCLGTGQQNQHWRVG